MTNTTPVSASAEHKLDEFYFNSGYNYALANIRYIIEGLEVYNKPQKEIIETI